MNAGPLPAANREEGLGRALQERLAHLAARLERLTGGITEDDMAAARASSLQPGAAAPAPVTGTTQAAPPAAAFADPAPADAKRPTPDERLRTIRQRISELKARHGLVDGTPGEAMETPSENLPEPIRAEATPVTGVEMPAEIRAEAPRKAVSSSTIDLEAAIAEISARQRTIDASIPRAAVASRQSSVTMAATGTHGAPAVIRQPPPARGRSGGQEPGSAPRGPVAVPPAPPADPWLHSASIIQIPERREIFVTGAGPNSDAATSAAQASASDQRTAELASEMATLRQTVSDLARMLPAQQPAAADGSSEVAALRQTVHELIRAQQNAQLPAVSAEVAELRQALNDLTRTIPAQQTEYAETVAGEVDALRRTVADLITSVEASRVDDRQFAALSEQIADIRGALDANAEIGRPDYENIIGRLEGIDKRVADAAQLESVAQQILHRMPAGDRFDMLAAEIDRLAERIDSGSPRGDFDKIEARIAGLEKIESLITTLDGKIAAAAGNGTAQVDQASRRLENEVMGIRNAVEELFSMLHSSGSPALSRIEQRLTQVTDLLNSSLSAAPKADSVTDLLHRLEQLATRNENTPAAIEALTAEVAGLRMHERSELSTINASLDSLATRLEAIVTAAGLSRAELATIDERISLLTRRADQLATEEPTADRLQELQQLKRQVASLTDRLASMPPEDRHAESLGRLEEQVGSLMAELRSLPSHGEAIRTLEGNIHRLEEIIRALPTNGDAIRGVEGNVARLEETIRSLPSHVDAIKNVEGNIARLEQVIREAKAGSTEAIEEAARNAVRGLSEQNQQTPGRSTADAALIAALENDLRELQSAARRSDRRNGDNLDAVNQTLDRIVERLTRLESDTRAAPAAAAPAPAKAAAAPAPAKAAAAPIAESRPAREAPAYAPADDRPIRPGAGRPDPVADRKADFITAARRAAQAAAAEHASAKPLAGDTADAYQPATPRTPGFISTHKRPLLLAAAAIILAIAAITVFKPFSRGTAADPVVPIAAAADELYTVALPPDGFMPADATAVGAAIAPPAQAPVRLIQPNTTTAPAFEPAAPATTAAIAPAPEAAAPAVAEPAAATPAPAAAPDAVVTAETEEPMPAEAVGSLRLRMAAAAGDPAALYEVGDRYATGRNVAVDMEEAAEWFGRAADRGLAVAQYRLGILYETGQGVPVDRPAAQAWYTVAAHLGNIQAMHNLGVMLSQGIDGVPDFVGAIAWFSSAAEHGIRDSQYNLGVIYARGIGTPPDLITSYKWFALAAAQGDADAAARRDDVAAALSADQLATARASVSAWSPITPIPAANEVVAPAGGWDAPEQRVNIEDRQALVRLIQELLIARGYDPGPADGMEGPRTRDAVAAFQQSIGLQPTGEPSQAVLDALNAARA